MRANQKPQLLEKLRKFVQLFLEARDLDCARQELEQCRQLRIFFMTNQDEIYPKKLRRNADLPILMYGCELPLNFTPK